MPAVELLTLLHPELPRSRSALRELESEHREQGIELQRLMDLCQYLQSVGGTTEQRRCLAAYLNSVTDPQSMSSQLPLPFLGTPDELYETLCQRLGVVHTTLRNFTKTYIPPRLREALFLSGETAGSDIFQPLRNGFSERPAMWKPDSPDEQRLIFAAQRDFILSVVNLDQLIRGRWIGYQRGPEDLRAIVRFLVDQGIVEGTITFQTVRSLHDPANSFRTVWAEHLFDAAPSDPAGNFVPRQTKLHCARLCLKSELLPVFIQVRRKGFLQTLGKMRVVSTHKEKPSFDLVQDRRGLCIAMRTAEELKAAADYLQKAIPFNEALGSMWKQYREGTGDNPHSASAFTSISFFRLLAGRRYQLQFRLGLQHLDLLYSRGPENHTLYHLRQYTAPGGLFDWLFPPEIYGIRWNDPAIFEGLVHHVLASLPR